MSTKSRSKYSPYRQKIEELAAQGYVAREIMEQLPVSGWASGLRRYMVKEGIPTAPSGSRPGEKNHQWTGGVMTSRGYRHIKVPGHPRANPQHGYVREHILVMEGELQRELRPGEVVHHIDGNTENNHPDNLQLFASNGEHLAATLKGKTPNWTPEGREKIKAVADSRRGLPQSQIPGFANLHQSKTDDEES